MTSDLAPYLTAFDSFLAQLAAAKLAPLDEAEALHEIETRAMARRHELTRRMAGRPISRSATK